jgi:hypothetical protein
MGLEGRAEEVLRHATEAVDVRQPDPRDNMDERQS